MTENLPNYSEINPPDGKPFEEYTTHQRRAVLLRAMRRAGSPTAVNYANFAKRFDVHRSTVSRDADRIRESIGEHLGDDAKMRTSVLFEGIVTDLLEADDWRAKKAAWDVVMDWNDWLADIGEQHREPKRSELDVDVDSRHAEVAYRVVREGDDEPLPTTDDGDDVDYDALGFTSAPESVDVEAVDEAGGVDE